MSRAGGGDRALDLGRATFLDVGEHLRAPVGHDRLECRAGFDPFAADHERYVDALACHLREPFTQRGSLRRTGRVALDRLVDRGRRTEDAGGAHGGDCIVVGVRVTRHLYDAPGFGVGEVWVRGETILQHELACEVLRGERGRVQQALGGEQERVQQALPGSTARTRPIDMGPAVPKPSTASPNGGARLPARTLPAELSHVCANFVPDLCRRLGSHLAGVPTSYEGIPIDLDWATPLQRELVAVARAIPWGEVVSYGELAALAGAPGAARAAGSFCAGNRFSLIVPCHRVVAANGIGGYGSAGPQLKRRLLALEGVSL